MMPNSINPGASRANRNPRTLATPDSSASGKSKEPMSAKKAGKQPEIEPEPGGPSHTPYQSRSRAGSDTPSYLSYSGSLNRTESTDNFLPKPPKGGKGPGPSPLRNEIPMEDLTPAGKSKRKERPLDPSLQAITASGPFDRHGPTDFEIVPMNSASSSRRPSTDEVGLPLPATAPRGRTDGKSFREVVREEDAADVKKGKRIALAAGAALTALTTGAATYSSLKAAGKA